MELTIYGDILFLTNFLMDLGILFLTVQLSRIKLRLFRLSLATALLALYGTISFVPEFSLFLSWVGRLGIGMIAVWILGPSGGWRGYLKARVIFSLVSAGMGGVVYALVLGTDLGRKLQAVSVNGSVYFLLDVPLLLAGLVLSYGLLFWFRQICIRNFSRDKILIPLEFSVGGEVITITALADTGCELTVPVTGEGVLLVSDRVLKGITPRNSFWLPVHTANGDGRIPAFYPDAVLSLSQFYEFEKKPVVGIVQGRMSRDGLYSGILNPEILVEKNMLGGKCYENETTAVAAILCKNLVQAVSHSPKGGLLHRRKRDTSGTSWTGGRGDVACPAGYSGRTRAGTKNTHRAESPVGSLHSTEV